MNESAQRKEADNGSSTQSTGANKVIKRFGGRHLIFRAKQGGWWLAPRPYVLVSSFRGPIWMFYGAGQIWVTHKKIREIGGWMARVPRLNNKKVLKILDAIENELSAFINFCNEHGIEGTIVIESKVIEFHWTFGDELDKESQKKEHTSPLDQQFQTLCDRFQQVKQELGV